MNVINLDDARPHITVIYSRPGFDACKNVHVAPVKIIKDFVSGKADIDPDLLRAIVSDWLESLLNGIT